MAHSMFTTPPTIFQNLLGFKNFKDSVGSIFFVFILSVGSMSLFESALDPFQKISGLVLFLISIKAFMNWGQSEVQLVDSHLMTELNSFQLSMYYGLRTFFKFFPLILFCFLGLLVGMLTKADQSQIGSVLPKLLYQLAAICLAMLIFALLSNIYLAKPKSMLAKILPLLYLVLGGSYLYQGAEGAFSFATYTAEFAANPVSQLLTALAFNIGLILSLNLYVSDILPRRFTPFKNSFGLWALWVLILIGSISFSSFGIGGLGPFVLFLIFNSIVLLYSPLSLLETGSFAKNFSIKNQSVLRFWLGGVCLYGLFLASHLLLKLPAESRQYYDQYLRELSMFAVQSFSIFALFEIGSLEFKSKNKIKYAIMYFILSAIAMLAVSALLKDHTDYTFMRSLVLIPGLNGMHEGNAPLPLIFTWALGFHLGIAAIVYLWWRSMWRKVESSLKSLEVLAHSSEINESV